MNKVYALAKQAELIEFESIPDSEAVTPTYESVVRSQQFAELIIRECVDYLNAEINRLQDYQNSLPQSEDKYRADVDLAIDKCLDNIQGIKEHFGIKG